VVRRGLDGGLWDRRLALALALDFAANIVLAALALALADAWDQREQVVSPNVEVNLVRGSKGGGGSIPAFILWIQITTCTAPRLTRYWEVAWIRISPAANRMRGESPKLKITIPVMLSPRDQ